MTPVDYRKFRIKNINSPEFRHIWLLLFWPIFGIVFYSLEQLIPLDFNPVYCRLDDFIPFCEYFVFPYIFWFIFIFWIIIYTFFFDVPAFKKYMTFVIITYSITELIYFIYPTEQNLRPTVFERDNFLVTFMQHFYAFDTNTNVCPSLHVIGSFAVSFTAWNSKRYSTVPWRIFFMATAVLISISTVYLKQHSIIDVFAGLAVAFIVYPIVFCRRSKKAENASLAY